MCRRTRSRLRILGRVLIIALVPLQIGAASPAAYRNRRVKRMNDLSPAVPRPEHVSDVAYYDFDMFKDPALLCDPHERVRDLLRLAPPVFCTPRNGGHWI